MTGLPVADDTTDNVEELNVDDMIASKELQYADGNEGE
jgi:hypothetical protein